MINITVYDPAMCCSTGICGAEVDQRLVTFAADLDWLKSKGVEVSRINLSQEPAKFAEDETVKTVLEKSGVEGLPVVMVNGAMRSNGRYPDREELAAFANVAYVTEAKSAPDSDDKGCCGGDTQKTTSGCC